MLFTDPTLTGILLRRYKRFLADVRLDCGSQVIAHCPNTGSMRNCSTPGSRVLLTISANPKRKYPLTLEAVEVDGSWVGVNTARTNKIVTEALQLGTINELRGFTELRSEVAVGPGCRLDLQLGYGAGPKTWIEVKNCSLAEEGCAMFPDAVTARGTKHLLELTNLVDAGERACIFFLVQRTDAERFRPAAHIDPVYAKALRTAVNSGVLALAYRAKTTLEGVTVVGYLPLEL